MSETESSGAVTAAAETASTPSTPPSATLPSTFSNNRGSGLARGKRPASPPPPTASTAPAAEYKPTAVSVITAPTEYKNPFAPPAPAAPAPTEAAAPAAPAAVPAAAETPGTPAAPVAEIRSGDDQAHREPAAPAAAAPEAKPAEIKILPPEAPKRVEHSWESDSFRTVAGQAAMIPGRPAEQPPADTRRDGRRGDRPYFRPERERRNDRPGEGRPAWGESRREGGEPPARPETPPAPAPAAQTESRKSGGLFGWVKKLFGGAVPETAKPEAAPGGERGFDHGGHRHRRRRRGGHGRGFQGEQRGPRDGQPSGENRGFGGENRGFGGDRRQHGGRRRRHHRGGGDYRGGRPEGPPPAGS